MERRQVRPINETKDILGGQADTLKRGTGSNRQSNPLNPFYEYPGGTENINLQNDPFGETTCSMGPANFAKAQKQGPGSLRFSAPAGVESEKAASVKSAAQKSQLSSAAKVSNRPQTAAAPIDGPKQAYSNAQLSGGLAAASSAASRKSLIQNAVQRRSAVALLDQERDSIRKS